MCRSKTQLCNGSECMQVSFLREQSPVWFDMSVNLFYRTSTDTN